MLVSSMNLFVQPKMRQMLVDMELEYEFTIIKIHQKYHSLYEFQIIGFTHLQLKERKHNNQSKKDNQRQQKIIENKHTHNITHLNTFTQTIYILTSNNQIEWTAARSLGVKIHKSNGNILFQCIFSFKRNDIKRCQFTLHINIVIKNQLSQYIHDVKHIHQIILFGTE